MDVTAVGSSISAQAHHSVSRVQGQPQNAPEPQPAPVAGESEGGKSDGAEAKGNGSKVNIVI